MPIYDDEYNEERANVDLASNFRWANRDLQTHFETFSIGLHATRGQQLSVCLEIDHNTRRDEVAANWGIVKAWADRVRRWQQDHGGAPGIPNTATINEEHQVWMRQVLDTLHEKGLGYGALAERVNTIIAGEIKDYVAAVRVVESSGLHPQIQASYLTLLELELIKGPYRDLIALGMNAEDAELHIKAAIEELKAGRTPFPPKAPVTLDMVRGRLRRPRGDGKSRTRKTIGRLRSK